MLVAGASLDHYVVDRLLGAGGMGEVYLARDGKLGRRVALKVLPVGDKASDAGARLLREARAAASLDHPNVVSIFEVGTSGGSVYIAMEYVDGVTLRERIGDAGVSIDVRVRWLVDVARALAAAHARGIVHRDVKPENVMLRADGIVKVVDFGVARRGGLELDATAPTTPAALPTMTAPGAAVGTPVYMAPEQVRGDPVDGRADQFGWGVTAYELLTGVLPWGAADTIMYLAKMLSSAPTPLRDANPLVVPEVAGVVARALSRDADARFASMDELITALEPHASLSPTRSLPPPRTSNPVPSTATTKPPSSVRPSKKLKRTLRASTALAALIGAAFGLRAVVSKPGVDAAAPTLAATPADAAPANTAITDLPLPASSNAEAVRAYKAGVQAERDGSWDAAERELRRALSLDPSMLAAKFRLMLISFPSREGAVRESVAEIVAARQGLSERDQALLASVAAAVQKDPPDYGAMESALRETTKRLSGDAELFLWLSFAQRERFEFDASLVSLERAITIDPLYADAWTIRPFLLRENGKIEDAAASANECAQRFPGASDCMNAMAMASAQLGRCDDVERATKQWRAIEPGSPTAWQASAEVLFALGRPREAVDEALARSWERAPERDRPRREATDRIAVALLDGDFVTAEKIARQNLARAKAGPNPGVQQRPLATLIRIARETGRDGDAVALATGYAKKMDALPGRTSAVPWDDVRLVVLHATPGFEAARSAWLREWTPLVPRPFTGWVWTVAYASVVETESEAKDAVRVLAQYEPLPPYEANYDSEIGKTLLLAGRPDDALPRLRVATARCNVFDDGLLYRRASYFLGMTLEQKGDTSGACVAYATLLAHWGHAKPASVTADKARARSKALRCNGPD